MTLYLGCLSASPSALIDQLELAQVETRLDPLSNAELRTQERRGRALVGRPREKDEGSFPFSWFRVATEHIVSAVAASASAAGGRRRSFNAIA